MSTVKWLNVTLLCCLAAARGEAALSVSTNFEGASARVLALDPLTQTIRVTPAGDPNRGWPCWWYLRVDGVEPGKPLILEVVASSATLPAQFAKPARRLDAAWSFPAQAAFSTDGIAWGQTSRGERHGNVMTYRVSAGHSSLWLAWGPPFTPKDAGLWVEQIARTNSFAQKFTLAQSREGRSVPALQVSEGSKPAALRSGIWIIARQHAWEAGGSWVGIGFAEWLVSSDLRAKRLRQDAEVYFVPIMDVDRVATGDGGKECSPRDANRDWTEQPYWPEVAAVQQRVRALVKEKRMDLLVDLHNPGAGTKRVDLWITPTNFLGALAARNQERFFRLLCEEITEPIPVKAEPHWDGPNNDPRWQHVWHELSCPWVYEHGNPQTVAVTIETPWNTTAGTMDGYRATGRGLGRAIERFVREQSQSR